MKPLLSDEDLRMIDAVVAAAPPLTGEEIAEIRAILRPWEWRPLSEARGLSQEGRQAA